MSMTQVSLDAGTLARLDAIASQLSLTREEALREAVGNYLGGVWQVSAIEEGVREADAGNFATETEVKTAFARWGVDAR